MVFQSFDSNNYGWHYNGIQPDVYAPDDLYKSYKKVTSAGKVILGDLKNLSGLPLATPALMTPFKKEFPPGF